MLDLTVFVFIDSPASAGSAKPTVLIGRTVEIAVDVSIDFDSVFVVTPLIDLAIVIPVRETAQRMTVGAVDHQPFKAITRFILAGASIDVFFGYFVVGHIALTRGITQGFDDLRIAFNGNAGGKTESAYHARRGYPSNA